MQSLRSRAAEQSNPSARNFYLTAALDSYGLLDWNIKQMALVDDVAVVLNIMKYRLKAELTDGVNKSICIHFTDTGDTYRLQASCIYIIQLFYTSDLTYEQVRGVQHESKVGLN